MISHLFSELYNKFYTSAGATPDDLRKKYWYTLGGKIHNSTCKYYGKTEGFYTDGRIDKSDCQYCGGRSLPQDYDNLREVMQKRSINRNGNSD